MQDLNQLLAQHGLILVFANVLLTQAGIPLPAVPVLVVAGALAAQGEFSYTALLLTAVAAALLGDIPWFFAGRRYGHRVLRTLCRIAIEPDSCVKQTESIFERWGAPALLVAKYTPGFATVAPPLAGAMRLGFLSFLLFSTAGALLCNRQPHQNPWIVRIFVVQFFKYFHRRGKAFQFQRTRASHILSFVRRCFSAAFNHHKSSPWLIRGVNFSWTCNTCS